MCIRVYVILRKIIKMYVVLLSCIFISFTENNKMMILVKDKAFITKSRMKGSYYFFRHPHVHTTTMKN